MKAVALPSSSGGASTAAASYAQGRSHIRQLATSGVAWGFAVSAGVTAWTAYSLGGADYYRTALAVRGYAPAHRMLRPSGPIGQSFGVVGTLLILVPFIYMARKRISAAKSVGTLRGWLEIHLFCGIVGPILVTLHTSFKFNGIISAAYWSMVMVMLSGFVGRYLYVRIPRSIRGNELTRADMDAQAEELRQELSRSVTSDEALHRIEAFELAAVPSAEADLSFFNLLFGEMLLGRKLHAVDRELAASGFSAAVRAETVRLTAERSTLLRRAAYLNRTKKLFALWHVFHLPLVYLLLVIAAAHIGVALYLGYVPFRW